MSETWPNETIQKGGGIKMCETFPADGMRTIQSRTVIYVYIAD